jgi:type IV pilus assembly protein PilA
MTSFINSLKRQDGFTLVELMVVVAIIGLLSAVAIPNFKKYQAKSKTSEAKLQLSAIYTAMQSWYSDYDNYANCLNLMGFDPAVEQRSRYYAVGFPIGVQPAGNTASVTNGAPATCDDVSVGNNGNVVTPSSVNNSAWGAGKLTAGIPPFPVEALTTTNVPDMTDPDNTTFSAGALGIIDPSKAAGDTADAWTINQNKRIVQNRTGY